MKLGSCSPEAATLNDVAQVTQSTHSFPPQTILLVEDEAFVRNVTAEVLELAGYRVLVARSADEALESYRRCLWPVDLLLADVILPGISGPDLALEFLGLCPRARVLLVSGQAEPLVRRDQTDRKKWPYLAKPFSTSTLLSEVRQALDQNLFAAQPPPSPH